MLKIGVLISGRGSNMKSLVADAQREDAETEIACVISNVADAPGLHFAQEAGLAHAVYSHKSFNSREEYDQELSRSLKAYGVELVCLAGFMRLLSAPFVREWYGRLVNIHPSLLPAFKGLHVHEQVIEAGVRVSGCTVHFVSPEMDEGPIIGQAVVPVLPHDTADRLAERVLSCEHSLYPRVVRAIACDDVELRGSDVMYRSDRVAKSLILHNGLQAF